MPAVRPALITGESETVMSTLPRRTFLSRFGLGLTAAGSATLGAGVSSAQTPQRQDASWQAARHPQDDWLDRLPGKHRFVFDSTSPEGAGLAINNFINNYFTANQSAYGLKNEDLAVVLVMRHLATPFAFNDAMWEKYGVAITQRTKFNDPATNQPPKNNIYNRTTAGAAQPDPRTLNGVIARGVHLAVCGVSTRAYAGAIATATNAKADAIYEELAANLVSSSNARIVPAGIVAVNRAQERGYAFVFAS